MEIPNTSGDRLEQPLEQITGAVQVAPLTDVREVEAPRLNAKDVSHVVDVLGSLSVLRPAQLRHDDVFGRRHEDFTIQELRLSRIWSCRSLLSSKSSIRNALRVCRRR